MSRYAALVFFVLGVVAASGCAGCIEKVAPGQVGVGVARLSIRNAAYVSKLALNDTKCGFKNPAIQRAGLVQGQAGEQGAVTWKISDCVITLPEETALANDCSGHHASVKGTVTVSGTQRIRGTITGDTETPVIPDGADAVRVELDVTFDQFTVRKSDSKSAMTNVSGQMHYVFEPRIALSRLLGVCAVQTLNFSFSDVTYRDGKVIIEDGPDHIFPVDVPALSLTAQVGKWQGQENSFTGDVTVWDTKVAIPVEGDTRGLDTEYTAGAYLDSISCDPDLVLPVSYACPSLKTQLVHGASRLSVKTLGALTSLIDADARCGFSSPQVLAAAAITGTVGSDGSVLFTLPAPCVISFSTKTAISKDCTGDQQFAQGTVSITGTKRLTGVLTGDPVQPVAPSTRDPAELVISASLVDFTLSNSSGENTFVVQSGTLGGTVRPRVAIDARSAICSNTTSIAELPVVTLQDAKLKVNSSGFDFQVNVSRAELVAQSGTKGDRTNYLSGTAISDGVMMMIPPPGASPVLDPTYSEAKFISSFSCAPGFQLAPSDDACSLDNALAANVARLTVQSAGTIASMIQADDDCGFSALPVKTNPSEVQGATGQMGFLRWNLNGCRLGTGATVMRAPDCLGTRSFTSGTVSVTAERVVTGERDTSFAIFDSIIPRDRNAMTIKLGTVSLTEFSSWTVLPSEVDPYAKLVLHSGTLSATVAPALGERKSKPGVFDVGTPVATFTDVQLTNATATLFVAGKRFSLVVPAIKVSAQNGTLQGRSNTLSGLVTMGSGRTLTIAPTALDPEFEQAAFDSSYACTADLKATIPLQ